MECCVVVTGDAQGRAEQGPALGIIGVRLHGVFVVAECDVMVFHEKVDNSRRSDHLGILVVQREAAFGTLQSLAKRLLPRPAPAMKHFQGMSDAE